MADKKLNEVSQLTDFDYALVVKGNDVAKVTKQQLATILGELIEIASCIKDKGMKVVDANETPMNEFVFAYIGSTNLPTDSSPGGLLTLGFMDGSVVVNFSFFSDTIMYLNVYNGITIGKIGLKS